ncbi:MAG TPA: MFS transporter [Thermoanaerobacterales bacterium]|nr:MFS transporter [Thermoanaerobacterales bacterium]
MKKAWAVMWSVYLASIVVVINQFKVPPVLQVIMEQLNVDMAVAGWLMSIFALAGIILAIPAAFILDRFGPKISGLIALACTILGSVIGGLASGPAVLLFGRCIEGIGLGLIGVAAPAVIAMWFQPQEMGLPMGIWATWVPVGSSIVFNIASPLESSFGWRSIWWFGAVLGLIAFIVYGLVVTKPDSSRSGPSTLKNAAARASFAEGFRTLNIWLLAIGFAGLMFSVGSISTWTPAYFNQVFGIDAKIANFYTSLIFMINIFGNITAGWLLGKVKNRNSVLVVAVLLSTILYPLGFRLNSQSNILPYIITLGVIPAFIPTTIFTLAPESMPAPELGGLAMGIVNLGSNFGSMIGPPIVGSAVKSGGGWASGSYPILVIMLIALAASIIFAKVKTTRSSISA